MASASATGHTALTVRGNVSILRGRIDAAGTGSGTVTLSGSGKQVDIVRGLAREVMEAALPLDVPVVVDVKVGTDWSEV